MSEQYEWCELCGDDESPLCSPSCLRCAEKRERAQEELIATKDKRIAEFEKALAASNSGYDLLLESHEGANQKIAELEKELKLAQQDAAFYRCCALSGEVPGDGAEPSAEKRDA